MKEVIDLFKCIVVSEDQLGSAPFVGNGYYLDFTPTNDQKELLDVSCKPIDIVTLFSVEEREQGNLLALLSKQILHYVEVNVLDEPGLFQLEVPGGTIVTVSYIKGITEATLGDMIKNLAYTNAPIKDVVALKKIIDRYSIFLELDKIQNNELRVSLFNPALDTFKSGDDFVRWMCYKATDNLLLIKSPEVIRAVSENDVFFTDAVLSRHVTALAKVFNRHKKIILAAKNRSNKTVINKISRLSKSLHVPIVEGLNKRFIAEAIKPDFDNWDALNSFSLRDKFKILQTLQFKMSQTLSGMTTDAYIIRNGKIHVKENVKTQDFSKLDTAVDHVMVSLRKDLEYLKEKNILLDPIVDYGLPVSRKQTLGNLPFGTQVFVNSKNISSGIYWENSWGARDLDLSTIDRNGERVGWGCRSGYDHDHIIYSGDLVDAPDGAMEFMTSNSKANSYGLFVNIFNGEVGSQVELVVGTKSSKQKWIDDVVVREKHTLNSKGSILGFVKGSKFIVYAGRLDNSRVSGGKRALIERGLASSSIILRDLLDSCFIPYDIDRDPNKDYHYDLSYNNFTYDKLEALFVKDVP